MTKRWRRADKPDESWYLKASTAAIALESWAECNSHGNQAGFYIVDPAVINLYVKIPPDKLVEIFAELPEVEWFPDHNIIWLKNFLYEQNKNIHWYKSAGKALATFKQKELVQKVLDYNLKEHNIIVPLPEENNEKPQTLIEPVELPDLSINTKMIMRKWEADIGNILNQIDSQKLIDISDEYELTKIVAAIDYMKKKKVR